MRWFASNLRTFLLALVLGVAVWVSAVSAADPDEVHRYPRAVPIEIVGQDPGLILTNEVPTTMNVTLRAPRSVWESLNTREDSVRAILDLSGRGAGEHEVNLQVQVGLRPTQIMLANPDKVTVNLESFKTATLPLIPTLIGQPSTGYQAADATLALAEVMISGPEALVNEAMKARVAINLDGVRESITNEPVPIQIIDSKGEIIRGLTINPETVEANVPIRQQGGYRDLAVNVVVNGQQAPGYRLENISVFPLVVTVVSDDPALVASLPGVVDTQPLDLEGAREDISTRLALDLPEGVNLAGPQTVQVQVSITPIQTSITLKNQPIKVVGLGENLMAQPSTETVDVIISGPAPVLETLTADDIEIIVDVTDRGPGNYILMTEAKPSIDNLLIESINPPTVEVVISIPGTLTPVTPSPTPFP